MSVTIQRGGDGVLTLTLSHPPVNAAATALRAALFQALRDAEADDTVRAVVIAGNDKVFCAGADLGEFSRGSAFDAPSFHAAVLPFLHGMRKPVVAALAGRALGGGLELALWCHARVAAPDAPLGLPETSLGLMPGAGGTQLLPRAVGLERATSMIVAGTVVPASALEGTALLDAVVPASQVLTTAQQLALRLAQQDGPLPHLARLAVDHPQPQGFLAFARSQARARRDFTPSMLTAIDAIALSLRLPALEGLAAEFEMFRPLVASPAARAIRHAFFAERASAAVDDLLADIAPRRIQSAAVIGAGFMGAGIAHCLARAGIDVRLFDARPGAAAAAATSLQGQKGVDPARVQAVDRLDALGGVDLAIEAIVEDLGAKKDLMRQLAAILKPGAILATNTSTLDVDAMAAVTGRAADVVGLHFFGPAPVMRLLEVVRAAATAPDVLASALALARRMGKVAIVSRVAPGFIGNRIFDAFLAQALDLAAQGVAPARIDGALERWGWRMGPFRTMDLIGNDVLVKARTKDAFRGEGEALQEWLVAQGWLGQKTGQGWYRHEPGARRPAPNPALQDHLGDRKAALADDQIVDRCMFALVNEAARVLEEGVAQRASDIDVAFLLGYGFPRLRGGPLHDAAERGLWAVDQGLRRLAQQTGEIRWKPAPLLERLAQTTGAWPAA